MGSVDLGGDRGGRGVKKAKRIGFRLDMTPLVDVAFLLLTFFMFATTMAQPQIMEMSVPPKMDQQVDVPQSKLLNLYIRKDGKLFYDTGMDPMLRPLKMDELKAFAVQRNMEKGNDLIMALKIDQRAQYASLIRVLDELGLAEGELIETYRKQGKPARERRFTFVEMTPDDKTRLEAQP